MIDVTRYVIEFGIWKPLTLAMCVCCGREIDFELYTYYYTTKSTTFRFRFVFLNVSRLAAIALRTNEHGRM